MPGRKASLNHTSEGLFANVSYFLLTCHHRHHHHFKILKLQHWERHPCRCVHKEHSLGSVSVRSSGHTLRTARPSAGPACDSEPGLREPGQLEEGRRGWGKKRPAARWGPAKTRAISPPNKVLTQNTSHHTWGHTPYLTRVPVV